MSRKEELTGFLDRGVRVTGELEFQSVFRIDGFFSGKIHSGDVLVIGDEGTVEGEIEAGTVSVSGVVRGTIRARERIEIQKHGKVFANVVTRSLQIEEGGLLQGKCEMEFKEGQEFRPLEWKTQKG